MTEHELTARKRYRIVGTSVEADLPHGWKTILDCRDEQQAKAAYERCVERFVRWLRMTDAERRRVVLWGWRLAG